MKNQTDVVIQKNTANLLAPGGAKHTMPLVLSPLWGKYREAGKGGCKQVLPLWRGWHVVPGEGVIRKRHPQFCRPQDSGISSLFSNRGFTARSVTPQCRYAGYSGRTGFTLIELLVVVLIIGILAAVAVPQYQKAVEKSRATEALVIIKALAEAEQLFYLANGDYSYDLTLLDLDVPGVSTTMGVGKAIETNYFICRASSQSNAALWKDALAVCARKGPNSVVYTLVHTKDGSDYCVYYSDFGQQICKSFGKEKAPEVRENTYRI